MKAGKMFNSVPSSDIYRYSHSCILSLCYEHLHLRIHWWERWRKKIDHEINILYFFFYLFETDVIIPLRWVLTPYRSWYPLAYSSKYPDDLGYQSRYTKSTQNPRVLGVDIFLKWKSFFLNNSYFIQLRNNCIWISHKKILSNKLSE